MQCQSGRMKQHLSVIFASNGCFGGALLALFATWATCLAASQVIAMACAHLPGVVFVLGDDKQLRRRRPAVAAIRPGDLDLPAAKADDLADARKHRRVSILQNDAAVLDTVIVNVYMSG